MITIITSAKGKWATCQYLNNCCILWRRAIRWLSESSLATSFLIFLRDPFSIPRTFRRLSTFLTKLRSEKIAETNPLVILAFSPSSIVFVSTSISCSLIPATDLIPWLTSVRRFFTSLKLSSLPSIVRGICRYINLPAIPLKKTATMFQKLIETNPPNLKAVWNSTINGPSVHRKIWNSSQCFNNPHLCIKRNRFRAMYPNTPSMIRKVPTIPNPCPVRPLGFRFSWLSWKNVLPNLCCNKLFQYMSSMYQQTKQKVLAKLYKACGMF